MSEISRIVRHWDFVLTIGLIGVLAALSAHGTLKINDFSPALAAGIFTVVIGASISLLAIFASFEDAISNADDGGHLNLLRKVFYWPIVLSIIGFIIAIAVSVFSIQDPRLANLRLIFSLEEYVSLLLAALLIYAVLSFREVFRTVYYVIVGLNRDSDDSSSREASR